MFKSFFCTISVILLFVMCVHPGHADVPDIVFVSRNLTTGGSLYYTQMGLLPGIGPYSRFSVTGGRLMVRQSNASVRVLVDSAMSFNGIKIIDVSDPCVNWDGVRILFSGIEHRDSSWRIYEINADGSGFRKVTFSNRNISLAQFGSTASKFVKYDDIDPCYLPDNRICFASTRYPSLSFFGFRTTNLYIMNNDGTDLHRITTERNSAEEPSIDPVSGKIVFSRWWVNIDMPSNITGNGITRDSNAALSTDIGNLWWAARINPDGTGMDFYGGSFSSRAGTHSYKPVIMQDSKLISTFIANTSMTLNSGSSGIRWFEHGAGKQNYVAGVNMDNMVSYNNFPESWGIMQPPYAIDAVEFPGNKIMFSRATQVENCDYGIYTVNLNGSDPELLYDIPGSLELNAELLREHPVPPVITDYVTDFSDELPPTYNPASYFKNGALRFDCGNIFTNAGVDVPITDAPPIARNARIKLFLNFQRMDPNGKDSAILFLNQPIQYSGGFWIPEIPADIPVFDQVVDSAGKVFKGTKGQISHLSGLNYGRPGTGTQCVGCHAGHSFIPPPQNNYEALFTNVSTSAEVTQSSFKYVTNELQYPGSRVKDRKARNDSLTVNWIATGPNNEWVKLNWEILIDVRYFVLYNIKPDISSNTNIQVNDCEIFMYHNHQQTGHIASTGPISVTGTRIDLSNIPEIDEVKIFVKEFTGIVQGQNVAGLAEVETNARISFYEITGNSFISTTSPGDFKLFQNYPNPFNPVTKIAYELNSRGFVSLVVYDIAGREIKSIVNREQNPGKYSVDFKADGIPSGVYFYRLTTKGFTETRKMVLIR